MFDASIAPSAAPAPTTVWSSSMNRMICPLGLRDLLEHRLQPLLELAAVLGAGDERAHVERDDLLVLQPFRHVAADDALRQPLDDGGLADAGLADEHRVVLGAPREHLDHAADLLVAADHRIELALARQVGQVAAVPLERLILALGILIGHALVAADRRERLEHPVPGDAALLRSCAAGERPVSVAEGDEQVLGADVLVLQPLGLGLRRVDDQLHAGRQAHLARRTPSADFASRPRTSVRKRAGLDAHLPEHLRDDRPRAVRRAPRAGARA